MHLSFSRRRRLQVLLVRLQTTTRQIDRIHGRSLDLSYKSLILVHPLSYCRSLRSIAFCLLINITIHKIAKYFTKTLLYYNQKARRLRIGLNIQKSIKRKKGRSSQCGYRLEDHDSINKCLLKI